jgi:hypothetical protein
MKRQLRRAGRLYRDFTHYPATTVIHIRHTRMMPPVVVQLGHLVGLIYRADRGTGSSDAYIHLMRDPPRLVSNPAGDQLYIVGGTYRVTPDGIDG